MEQSFALDPSKLRDNSTLGDHAQVESMPCIIRNTTPCIRQERLQQGLSETNLPRTQKFALGKASTSQGPRISPNFFVISPHFPTRKTCPQTIKCIGRNSGLWNQSRLSAQRPDPISSKASVLFRRRSKLASLTCSKRSHWDNLITPQTRAWVTLAQSVGI
jgi:hypothetical protein